LEKELNFPQNPCNISHVTLTLVPHYHGKIKSLYNVQFLRTMVYIIAAEAIVSLKRGVQPKCGVQTEKCAVQK